MIGSHNSFSYLKPSKWWMRLLTPWHRCQSKNVNAQILFEGVRYLDIRVRFIKKNPVFVHNNIVYESCFPFLQQLEMIGRQYAADAKQYCREFKKIPYRLVLDVRKCPKDFATQRTLFDVLVCKLQQPPYSIYFELDEARIFWDWDSPIVKSKYDIKEIHTSVCSPWYKYILGTKWFARKNNKDTYVLGRNDNNTVYLIDYVNIIK